MGSKFFNKRPYNPVVLQHRIEKNKQAIEYNKIVNDHKYRALEDFVGLLINFASHDIKNAVHTMDGMISTITLDNITEDDLDGLKLSMDNIREVLDSFGKFNLEKKESSFPLSRLFNCLDILHRPKLRSSKTHYAVEYDNVSTEMLLHHDFHPFLQMFNNLMINSLTALDTEEIKRIKITISPTEDEAIQVIMADSGKGIDPENREKVFNPYFTTKNGGSGVGLTHAKHVVTEYQGSIELLDTNDPGFKTTFKIIIPINLKHNESQSTNN